MPRIDPFFPWRDVHAQQWQRVDVYDVTISISLHHFQIEICQVDRLHKANKFVIFLSAVNFGPPFSPFYQQCW